MNDLQVFTNKRLGKVRVMQVKGQPYFVGKDIAEALGYSNASKAIMAHVHNDDKVYKMIDIADSQNGNVPKGKTKTALINESGMYALIFGSKLEKAKEFKHWVTSEVLPSIRKTGGYNANQNDVYKQKRLEIMAMNAKARTMKEENKRLDALIKSGKAVGLSAYEMLDLIKERPQKHEKTYSASEVGVMLGVSANKIGRLATANDLKTEEYGDWFKETINDGSKEVSSFRYNEKGVEKLRELLNTEE